MKSFGFAVAKWWNSVSFSRRRGSQFKMFVHKGQQTKPAAPLIEATCLWARPSCRKQLRRNFRVSPLCGNRMPVSFSWGGFVLCFFHLLLFHSDSPRCGQAITSRGVCIMIVPPRCDGLPASRGDHQKNKRSTKMQCHHWNWSPPDWKTF